MAGNIVPLPSGRASTVSDAIELRTLATLGAGAEAERLGMQLADLASRLERALSRGDKHAIARLAGGIERLAEQSAAPHLTDLAQNLCEVVADSAARAAVGRRLIRACLDRLVVTESIRL